MRYLITGGSGYIGGRLTDVLAPREETELIVDVDVNPPARQHPKVEFVQGDVRDAAAMAELLARHKIDALLHLAFLLNPIRDEERMYDIDVNGTESVLRAASEAGTQQVLVTSSASAYGAFPDNPNPITEDWPVRGVPDFSYARHKAEADRVCQLWAARHPDRVMTIVRPAIVFGPDVDNFIIRGWTKARFFPLIDGADSELQLVHNDDVADALIVLLDKRADGAFNLAADDTMSSRESAEMIGLKTKNMQLEKLKRQAKLAWRFHLPGVEAPPGYVNFAAYDWVVSNQKLRALGWQPKHSTRQIFEETMRA
ncbi:MAG: NAD-dependent epimerase/dehydratase family protein, partial [Solirubrobacterales bacterium]